MGLVLAAIGLAALVIAIVVLLRARRRSEKGPVSAPRDPFAPGNDTAGDPRLLRAGDMVEYLGKRLFVRGSLRLSEGGFTWSEHFLDAMDATDADDGRYWLSVEEDPNLEVILWSGYDGSELLPHEHTLTIDGISYRRTEHGTATYRSEGTTGLAETGRVEYADFEGPPGRSLAFERFPGDGGRGSWEASLGERIPTGTLVIYPGSDG